MSKDIGQGLHAAEGERDVLDREQLLAVFDRVSPLYPAASPSGRMDRHVLDLHVAGDVALAAVRRRSHHRVLLGGAVVEMPPPAGVTIGDEAALDLLVQ